MTVTKSILDKHVSELTEAIWNTSSTTRDSLRRIVKRHLEAALTEAVTEAIMTYEDEKNEGLH